MIVKSGEADRFAANPPKALAAALFYGPDEGLVRERAEVLAKSVVSDLSDPFRVAEFTGSAIESDPARLFDEAAAISMLGGRRVLRIRDAGNGLTDVFKRFFADRIGDALIVLEADELQKSSALRRLFEGEDEAAAVACYSDDDRGLARIVRDGLKAEGLSIDQTALDDAVARLGSDRGLTRQEIAKLALYAKGEKTVTARHVRDVMGDESELRMEEACDAAGEGNFTVLDRTLMRLWASGYSPVAALRQSLGHFQRLLLVRAESDEGGNTFAAMKRLRPPPHFSREKSFTAQVARWQRPRLEEALHTLYEAEALVKTTAVPPESACGQALISVCLLARQG